MATAPVPPPQPDPDPLTAEQRSEKAREAEVLVNEPAVLDPGVVPVE